MTDVRHPRVVDGEAEARRRRRKARALLNVSGLKSAYRPLRAAGAVSRADYFELSHLADRSIALATRLPLGAVARFRRALQETTPEDVEEFLCKAGLGNFVDTCLSVGLTELDDLLDDEVGVMGSSPG